MIKALVHLVTGSVKFYNESMKDFGRDKYGKKILEIGSGTTSAEFAFNDSNEFIKSDIDPAFGHMIIDVTNIGFREHFDIILCNSVLEHVPEYKKGINNMYKALKPKGILAIVSPMYYPLHSEPGDYWRFTEHGFRKMLTKFGSVNIRYNGIRRFPFSYFVEAVK